VNISASASDSQTWVTKVEFYLDGSLVGSNTYGGILFYSAGYSNGSHTLIAKAYDAVGNVGTSAAVSFTISNSNSTPITVSITAPSNGAVVSRSITLSASASSNVSYINYYLTPAGSYGAGYIASVSTSPYNFVLDTTKYANGSTSLYAIAFDSLGNQGVSSTVTFTISNSGDITPPTTPAAVSAVAISASQINISWTASTDNVGVTGYKVYRNGTAIGTPSTTSYSDTGLLASTTYTYTVVAYDAAGNVSPNSSPASATTQSAADTTPPTVQITSPAGPTVAVKSTVTISASASDNVGVTKVQFYVNGTLTCTIATTNVPYNCSWKVPASKNQTYQLQAKASDAAGNVGSSAIVTVTGK
jgi:chitodextrinase